MQRGSIIATFLGALVLLSAAWIIQKPLLQVYWAVNSRIPDYTHLVQNNPFLRISTGRFMKRDHSDQRAQRSQLCNDQVAPLLYCPHGIVKA